MHLGVGALVYLASRAIVRGDGGVRSSGPVYGAALLAAGVYLLHPAPLVWTLAATLAVFATLVAANCIGIFIANFTTSPADVLLYATAILFPLIYVSGFFRNQNPEGILETLRGLVPFAYANDALKTVFGLATSTAPWEVFVYPPTICAALVVLVCLTAPRLLSVRP